MDIVSEGAKKRLFGIAIKANERLEECVGEDDYKQARKRSDEWNEIVRALGLESELRQYYNEKRK